MIQKVLFSASLGCFLLLGVPPRAGPASLQSQSKQRADQTKSVSGKVTSIGNDKTTFSMEVNGDDSKGTIQFVLDKNTQVEGRVAVGTDAVVQYQPTDDGKNLALSIAPQGSQ
jgi:hypothetical protein